MTTEYSEYITRNPYSRTFSQTASPIRAQPENEPLPGSPESDDEEQWHADLGRNPDEHLPEKQPFTPEEPEMSPEGGMSRPGGTQVAPSENPPRISRHPADIPDETPPIINRFPF